MTIKIPTTYRDSKAERYTFPKRAVDCLLWELELLPANHFHRRIFGDVSRVRVGSMQNHYLSNHQPATVRLSMHSGPGQVRNDPTICVICLSDGLKQSSEWLHRTDASLTT